MHALYSIRNAPGISGYQLDSVVRCKRSSRFPRLIDYYPELSRLGIHFRFDRVAPTPISLGLTTNALFAVPFLLILLSEA